jgi:hypothetical protein
MGKRCQHGKRSFASRRGAAPVIPSASPGPDGLEELQRAELVATAMEAGVNLRTYLRCGEEARV